MIADCGKKWNHADMNSKHRKTLDAVFSDPINGTIEWRRIETLLVAVGCQVIEGPGASATFEKNGLRLTIHRPHPGREALRYRVRDVRRFLRTIGVTP